jgi:hypothetical protein
MNGNFADTFDIRVPRADTLIFLDLPRWVWTFRSNTRPAVLQTLERCRAEGRNVHHFLSRAQVSRFLRSAAAGGASTEEFP